MLYLYAKHVNMSTPKPLNFNINIPGATDNRTEEEKATDIAVEVHFKDEPEGVWHEGAFTQDHLLYIDGHEVVRLDLLLRSPDGETIDMEEEYENYRQEQLKVRLHFLARYLAKQASRYNKDGQ